MTDLAAQLERLGLDQYLDAFLGEGFDTWETLLDIQERDLDQLNVKLGHRRKLQRAIADYRGIPYERVLGSPARDTPADASKVGEASQGQGNARDGAGPPPPETKRRYRRHPKPDESAPEKPPSAYVIFSNKIREEVRSDNLSFTEIAKLVGDRWQKLRPDQKDPFESQAASLKERYNIKLSTYKKTDAYKEYMQYLSDFKAKHGQGPPTESSKRPKLDPQSSGGSISTTSQEPAETIAPAPMHVRGGSIGSLSVTSLTGHTGAHPSPAALSGPAILPTMIGSTVSKGIAGPRSGSPPSAQYPRDRRLIEQMSSLSSNSEDSGFTRSDSYDAMSRTATLSLSTPPAVTPPLPPHPLSSARSELSVGSDTYHWSGRGPPALQQHSSAPSPHAHNLSLPSPSLPGSESWRDRGSEPHRPSINPPSVQHGYSGPLSLPSPFSAERLPDLTRSPGQRILPPFRQQGLSGALPGFTGALPNPPVGLRPSQPLEMGARNHDRNENEAASTLAGLAHKPGHDTPQPDGYRRT